MLVAEHQSAGRGRQGRPWLDSPRSSLLVSLLLRPGLEHLTLLPLISGLAVAESLKDLCNVNVGLKWPNDVLSQSLLDGELVERKLVGILAEASITGGTAAVVVGMGMNLEFFDGVPTEIGEVATDLASLIGGSPPDRLEVLNVFLGKLEVLLQLLEGTGSKQLLSRYRDACITLGREVRMDTPAGEVVGRAVDISDEGGLVLETSTGLITVTAGDAHHVGGWGISGTDD